MKVKELIKELEKHNPEDEIITIMVGRGNDWNYTSFPTITTSNNKVWIQ